MVSVKLTTDGAGEIVGRYEVITVSIINQAYAEAVI